MHNTQEALTVSSVLPNDHRRASLIGRVWVEGMGAVLVLVRDDGIYDLTALAPTCSHLLQLPDPASAARKAVKHLAPMALTSAVLANSAFDARDKALPYFLAPCDLQAIKACGATFVGRFLAHAIDELTKGDAQQAEGLRAQITELIGGSLSRVVPDSPVAAQLKALLQAKGLWTQYLEVGIGPDAAITTKAQPMSAVGVGAEIGIHPRSTLNNSEPEAVLAVNSFGQVKGVAMGNDVSLRDFEARSALLMGRAKDNNASCAIGPFIRLFDEDFRFDDVRQMNVGLGVSSDGPDTEGGEPYHFAATSSMEKISRDPMDLVRQTLGDNHQYPDGFMLFMGTMYSPNQDRLAAGQGFSHRAGDQVRICAPQLGSLINWVNRSDRIAPWSYGIRHLMHDLAARGALA